MNVVDKYVLKTDTVNLAVREKNTVDFQNKRFFSKASSQFWLQLQSAD